MTPEPFAFTWPGKAAAAALAQIPSRYRLAPVIGESIAFATTANLFIEGDNLEALRILRSDYRAAVKMIYIDPPYNTGKAFLYSDRFASQSGPRTVGSESAGMRHSAWLSMMLPRLILARELLSEDGVLFVSIDDGEVHHLRMLLDEVFGTDAFVANIIWQKKYTRSNDARWFSVNHDYILTFARCKDRLRLNLQPRNRAQLAAYSNPDKHSKGPWKATPLHAKSGRTEPFSYRFQNGVCWSPPPGTYPRFSTATLRRLEDNDEIWFGAAGAGAPCRKSFLCDVKSGVTPITLWLHEEAGHNHEANSELKALLGGGAFDNPKPTRLIRRLLELATGPDSLILDFFAGSCTTADAVLQLNRADGGHRRFIMVQEPHRIQRPGFATIAEIGKERMRRLLARMDPVEGEDLGFRVMKLEEIADGRRRTEDGGRMTART